MVKEFNYLIKNVRIVDGADNPAFMGSIGIKDERIYEIGDVKGDAEHIIDADGLTATPGFIDVHNHGDWNILWYPYCENLVMQGITSFVGGNCGGSFAPLGEYTRPHNSIMRDYISDYVPFMHYPPALFPYNQVNEWMEERYGWSISWRTMGEYLKVVENKGMSMNYAPLVGHGAIRYVVMGLNYKRHSIKEEQAEMRELIHEAMKDGCIGMSTGLDYDPDVFASREEIIDGVSVLKEYDGIYSPHWRRTGRRRGITTNRRSGGIISGIHEVIDTCRKTGVRLNIAHISAGYEVHPNPPQVVQEAVGKATLEVIDEARAEGLSVTFDTLQYMETRPMPYLCSMHFVPWLRLLGSREKFAHWLSAADFRKEIKDAFVNAGTRNPILNPKWADNIDIVKHKNPNYEGKTLAEVASEGEIDPLDSLFDLVMKDPDSRGARRASRGVEDILKVFYKHPQCLISTDTFVFDNKRQVKVPPYSIPSSNHYSAYPSFLTRYVRDQKMLTLEEAVRKCTGLPAQVYNLKNRGLLQEGYYADLVLFDFKRLKTLSDVIEPRRYPRGIEYVFVNGVAVRKKGEHTKETPGKVLRRIKITDS